MDIRNFPVGRVKPLRGKFGIPIPGGVQGTPGGGTGDKGEDGTHSVILQLFPDLNNPNIWDTSPHYPLSPPASISEGGFTSPAPNQPHTPQNHHFNAFFFFSKYPKSGNSGGLRCCSPLGVLEGSCVCRVTFLSLFIHAGARRPALHENAPSFTSSLLPHNSTYPGYFYSSTVFFLFIFKLGEREEKRKIKNTNPTITTGLNSPHFLFLLKFPLRNFD